MKPSRASSGPQKRGMAVEPWDHNLPLQHPDPARAGRTLSAAVSFLQPRLWGRKSLSEFLHLVFEKKAKTQRVRQKVQLLSPWDQRGSTPDWAETLGTKRYEATTFWPAVNLKAFFALQPVRQFAFRPHFTPISNYVLYILPTIPRTRHTDARHPVAHSAFLLACPA